MVQSVGVHRPTINMAQAILFTNWTDEDFSWKYAGITHKFEAGSSVYLPDYKANHFAKHLVNRELIKSGKRVSDPTREELIAKCISGKGDEQSEEEVEIEVLNQNANQSSKSSQKFVCETCGFEAKSQLGLASHQRTHKNEGNEENEQPQEEDEENFEGLNSQNG